MNMQNVIVLGAAYGGSRAAHLLAQGLGKGFRVIMIDRNSHANHLYVIPRLGVLPGHEHKAFIPLRGVFHPTPASSASDPPTTPTHPHLALQASVIALTPHSVTIDREFPELGLAREIPYKYAIYALGSCLPSPINLWSKEENGIVAQPDNEKLEDVEDVENAKEVAKKEYGGTKQEGIEWLKRCQERIRRAGSVLVVGGGALGIQFATDIASLYPEKHVTLLHSRHRLLPRFDYDMHCEILKALEELRIDMILGERLDLESTRPEAMKFNEHGQRVVRTLNGREVAADILLLCTGQVPNTGLIKEMAPDSVDPDTKLAYVLPTMQLGVIPPVSEEELAADFENLLLDDAESMSMLEDEEEMEEPEEPLPETPFPHIFVIGDSADAFGAIKAGHTAYWQAEVAARNVIRLANHDAEMEANSDAAIKPECQADAQLETPQIAEPELEVSDSQAESHVGLKDESFIHEKKGPELERYKPGMPAIKVSLGIDRKSVYQIRGVIGRKETVDADDLDAGSAWGFWGMQDVKEENMYA